MAGNIAELSANLAQRINEIVDEDSVNFINLTFNNIWAELEPLMLLLLTAYIIIMGFGVMRGLVAVPLNAFLESAIKFGIIFAFVSSWPLFSTYIVDVITNTPDALAGVISGTGTTGDSATSQVGLIYNRSIASVTYIAEQRGWVLPYILAAVIFIPATIMMVFSLFLIVLSKIAIAVLVGVAPLFILFLMFSMTRQMFEAWLRQVINYIFVIVFTVAILGLTNSMTDRVVSNIPVENIVFGDVIPTCVVFLLVFLLLTQVMNIASSLAGVLSLSTQNIGQYFGRKLDRAAGRAAGSTTRAAGLGVKKGVQTIKNRSTIGTVTKESPR